MFTRFSDESRRALVAARIMAQASGVDTIKVEHLLLGLIETVPETVDRLARPGVGLEQLRTRIRETLPIEGASPPSQEVNFSEELLRVFAYAEAEADKADQTVGAEHLIAAMLELQETSVAMLLDDFGFKR